MSKAIHAVCTVCCEDRKSRYREFSPHAWTALLNWGEIDNPMIGQAMCDDCYTEFRDLLIERSDEVAALAEHVEAFGSVHDMSPYRPSGDKKVASAQIAS
jgi:hypothetical protein